LINRYDRRLALAERNVPAATFWLSEFDLAQGRRTVPDIEGRVARLSKQNIGGTGRGRKCQTQGCYGRLRSNCAAGTS